MFELKRGDDGWTPFSVIIKRPTNAEVRDTSKAREVKPMQARSNFDFASKPLQDATEDEAEATAETDPKDLSAISSAEVSEIDSSKSSSPQIQTPELIHPSSLPPIQEDPASAEKEKMEEVDLGPLGNLISMMNLGPKTPDVGAQP